MDFKSTDNVSEFNPSEGDTEQVLLIGEKFPQSLHEANNDFELALNQMKDEELLILAMTAEQAGDRFDDMMLILKKYIDRKKFKFSTSINNDEGDDGPARLSFKFEERSLLSVAFNALTT